jgi:hypothetical protein
MLEAKVKELYAQLIERFDSFERETQNMWDNILAFIVSKARNWQPTKTR